MDAFRSSRQAAPGTDCLRETTLSLCGTEKCNASDRSTAGEPFTREEVGTFAKKRWDPNGEWHYQNQVGTVPKFIVYKFSTNTMVLAAMRPQNLTARGKQYTHCKNFNEVPSDQYRSGYLTLEDDILRPYYDVTSS